MAEIKTLYKEPPEYSENKRPTQVATYEKKSFKTYQRIDTIASQPTEATITTTDDIDEGGVVNEAN